MRSYATPSLIEAGTICSLTQMDGPLGAEEGLGSSLVPPGPGESFPT